MDLELIYCMQGLNFHKTIKITAWWCTWRLVVFQPHQWGHTELI